MRRDTRQLYILCDLEGASGISPENKKAINHSSELWHREGRALITSDVLAVVEAANEFGIDEIILNDSHDNGRRVPNVLMTELPGNVRLVKRPYLLGKPRRMVQGEPYGIIIVGQHAMHGGGGFVPHTISAPFGEVTINDTVVGEIGLELAVFMGVKLLAVVGEQAAVDEANALCPNAGGVPVKSFENKWFPSASETRPVIRERVLDALQRRDEMTGLQLDPP
ncbi:M55 family metallopeptidase, partial [Candidatus Bipolaricaulota bacterium]